VKRPIHRNRAWAVLIDHGGEERKFLAGRYYFHQRPEASHAGCHVALFETRREARFAAQGHHDWTGFAAKSEAYYGGNVVRVEVVVKEVKP